MARWAGDLKLKKGGLKGWKATDPPATRRQHLRSVLNADGYATAIRRLQVLINLDSPARVKAAARSDIRWLQSQNKAKV